MTIFHGFRFIFRAIIMNTVFVSSGKILEEIIPFEKISVKKFLNNSFPVFLHGASQLSRDPLDANISVVQRFNDMVTLSCLIPSFRAMSLSA